MYEWLRSLYPICRSITGDGVRKTLRSLKRQLDDLTIHEVPSGTQAFDWTVPDEWNITDAYVENSDGSRVIDFNESNLHVVGYSVPVDLELDLSELKRHLYSLPEQPTAIPYVTSYYERRWGFCIAHEELEKLEQGTYRAVIQSTLEPGSLTYGELILEGESNREVLLSTYVCHPSMANNELSGPVVTTAIARWLAGLGSRRYTYRVVFVPETIGSIVYLSRNLEVMKRNTIAGFVVTCVGDDRGYSFMPSRMGDTLADRAARHVLRHHAPDFREYSFLDRGSDERQYCSPLVDLPVVSVMRSKYGCYPEYHTSLDDLALVTPQGLAGAFEVLRAIITVLENNHRWRAVYPCEPQLGKRDLYPRLSQKGSADHLRAQMNLLAYADGEHDVLALADRVGLPAWRCAQMLARLEEAGVIERLNDSEPFTEAEAPT